MTSTTTFLLPEPSEGPHLMTAMQARLALAGSKKKGRDSVVRRQKYMRAALLVTAVLL